MSANTQNKTKGRPKGQKSYVAVTVVELTKLSEKNGFKNLPISKKFLRSVGVDETKYKDAEPPVIATSGKIGRPSTKPETPPKATKPVAKPKAKAKKKVAKTEETEVVMTVTA